MLALSQDAMAPKSKCSHGASNLTNHRGKPIVTFIQTFSVITFALFSIVDLRSRFVPFIDIFFVLTGIYVFADTPWHVLFSVAVIWGNFQPSCTACAALCSIPYLADLLVGFGVRRKMIGKADLFALGYWTFSQFLVVAALTGLNFGEGGGTR
jgi:hypothetical protein